MIRLVIIETNKHSYRIFEGNKCLAEYVVENDMLLSAEEVEQLRIADYKAA